MNNARKILIGCTAVVSLALMAWAMSAQNTLPELSLADRAYLQGNVTSSIDIAVGDSPQLGDGVGSKEDDTDGDKKDYTITIGDSPTVGD